MHRQLGMSAYMAGNSWLGGDRHAFCDLRRRRPLLPALLQVEPSPGSFLGGFLFSGEQLAGRAQPDDLVANQVVAVDGDATAASTLASQGTPRCHVAVYSSSSVCGYVDLWTSASSRAH